MSFLISLINYLNQLLENCSSVHASTLNPLHVVQLKCYGIILIMFAMVPLFLLFLTCGYIACFSNFLFASDVLCNVSYFRCFLMFFEFCVLSTMGK